MIKPDISNDDLATLKKRFNALWVVFISKEKQIQHLNKIIEECNPRLLQSEREANHILTCEVESLRQQWQPIETAPKDNKVPLYLCRMDDQGNILDLGFNGVWNPLAGFHYSSPHNTWAKTDGIINPTHWAYQNKPLPYTK